MYTRILSLQKVRATQSHINAKINVKNTCERNESCKCAEICEEKKCFSSAASRCSCSVTVKSLYWSNFPDAMF